MPCSLQGLILIGIFGELPLMNSSPGSEEKTRDNNEGTGLEAESFPERKQ